MKHLEKTVIVLAIVFVILLIILICFKNKIDNIEKDIQEDIEEENTVAENTIEKGFYEVKDYETYYTAKRIIEGYIKYIKQINGDELVQVGKEEELSEEELKVKIKDNSITAIKTLLDNQYIEDLGVDDNKIVQAQNKYMQKGDYSQNVNYNIDYNKIFVKDISEQISIILVSAKLNNEELNMIIKIDKFNNTFSIFLDDYITKYGYNENMNEKDINIKSDNIQVNSYNNHANVNMKVTDNYIVSQYFTEYRMEMLNDTEKAYQLIDEEYRQKKYGSYEEFEKYIQANIDKITYTSVDKYQIKQEGEKTKYICIDTNGKYYIFIANSVTDYKVILDTYTIDLPEFLEQYNAGADRIKAGLNIQKVFDAINDEDYKYAYSKLDDAFKQNNFKTLEAFTKYAKENFYKNHEVKYSNYELIGDIHKYEVSLLNENQEITLNKNFLVQLKEGTDFAISFNLN